MAAGSDLLLPPLLPSAPLHPLLPLPRSLSPSSSETASSSLPCPAPVRFLVTAWRLGWPASPAVDPTDSPPIRSARRRRRGDLIDFLKLLACFFPGVAAAGQRPRGFFSGLTPPSSGGRDQPGRKASPKTGWDSRVGCSAQLSPAAAPPHPSRCPPSLFL